MSIRREELEEADLSVVTTGRRLAPVHPGEVLLKEFIEPMQLTRYKVAKETGVPQRRIDEICAGSRAVTADTALRLARFFGVEAQFWMNLQARYDLEIAARTSLKRIERQVKPLAGRPASKAAPALLTVRQVRQTLDKIRR